MQLPPPPNSKSYIDPDKQSKTVLKQYEENFPRKKPLKQMCDPLSDEEINAFTGTKRMKIKLDGDANVDTTTCNGGC